MGNQENHCQETLLFYHFQKCVLSTLKYYSLWVVTELMAVEEKRLLFKWKDTIGDFLDRKKCLWIFLITAKFSQYIR